MKGVRHEGARVTYRATSGDLNRGFEYGFANSSFAVAHNSSLPPKSPLGYGGVGQKLA